MLPSTVKLSLTTHKLAHLLLHWISYCLLSLVWILFHSSAISVPTVTSAFSGIFISHSQGSCDTCCCCWPLSRTLPPWPLSFKQNKQVDAFLPSLKYTLPFLLLCLQCSPAGFRLVLFFLHNSTYWQVAWLSTRACLGLVLFGNKSKQL